MHQSILVYRNHRYFWLALATVGVVVAAYLLHAPMGRPHGGTSLGYTLGTVGALLILWLMAFGVRKRMYGAGKTRLQAWLSAHVYLGLALWVIATLHTGFQFGWNVHTLAYVLMVVVILSGVFGVYAYGRYPVLMTENRRGLTLHAMLAQIAELGVACREAVMEMDDAISATVVNATQASSIGGGFWRQLSGRDPHCPTAAALVKAQQLAGSTTGAQAERYRRLIALLIRKDELLRCARRDVQLKALMDIWLYLHVPLSIALVVALAAHVVAVFYYR